MINHRRTTIASIAIVMLLLILTPPPVMAIENCSVEAWDTTPATPVNQCHYCSSSYSWNPIEKQCQDTKGSNCLIFSPSSISPITTCLRCDCKQALDSTNKCVDSPIANCEQISVVGATTTCSLCRNGDLYGYGKEDFGLKSDKSACIDNTSQTPNCQTYSQNDMCTECHSGYIFFTAPTEPQIRCLIRDSLKFCATGSIAGTEPNLNYTCSTCLSGFKKNAANTACSASMVPGCLASDFSDNCTGSCDTGNGWKIDLVKKICTKSCNLPLVISADGLNCVPVAHASCQNAGLAADCTCASPTAVYTFNRKQCASTPNNCLRQGPQGVSGCAECAANYQLVISINDPTQWNCVLITPNTKRVENCWVAYPVQSPDASDILHCRICKPEFILGEDYQCYAKLTGCPWWAQQSDLFCEWCSKGFYLQNNKCVKLPNKIDNWCDTFDDSFKCTKCKDGFQWNDANSICQRISAATIIANCDHYMKDDATQCMNCSDGYFTSTNQQICYPRIENCEDYNATGGCIKCRVGLGYVLQSGMCVMTPSFGCTQVDSNDVCISCIHEKQNGIELDFYLDPSSKMCVNNKGKIAHCKEYQSASVCKTCHDSIAVTGGNCPIPNTDNCLIFDQESFNCLVKGILNCESSGNTADNQCSQCQSGFRLNNYVESSQTGDSCVADNTIPNCTAYNSSQKCLQCQSDHAITGWDATSKSGSACNSISIVNDSIQTAYKIGKRNGCTRYSKIGYCSQCDSMFALEQQATSSECKSNTITNCVKSHPTDSTKCASCAATFTLDGYDTSTSVGTSCKAMGTTNCLASVGAACQLCIPNFTIKADSTGCQKPTGVVEGDEKTIGKHRSCDTEANYVLKQDSNSSLGKCILNGAADADIDGVYKTITDCIQYDDTKDTFRTCLKCVENQLPDATGANCVGITDCATYSTTDPYKCSKCLPGKALSDWTALTDYGTTCVAVGTLTDCEAINTKVTPNVCLKCGNNKTPNATGACVGANTIAGCTTYVGNKSLKCLTCDAATKKVLIGTITLSTIQDGGTKCVDITVAGDADLDLIKAHYGTLPDDCIAYDSATQSCVKCGNSKFLMPGSTANKSICGVIANCKTMVDAVTKIGACYECNPGFYLVTGYDSTKHNQGGTFCEDSTNASTNAVMTEAKALYTTLPTNCKAFDSNSQCAACLAGFKLITTVKEKPTCGAIGDCLTFVDNKNLNVNGRCLTCKANFSLNTDYDNTKPAEGASSCLADATGFCLALNPSTSKCVKCISTKFLDATAACVNPPTGCTVPHANDNTKCAQCNGTTHLLQGDKCVGDVTTNKQLLRPAQCGVYDKSGKCVWCFGTFINDSTNNGCKNLTSDANLSGCRITQLEVTTDKCVTCSTGKVLAGVVSPSTLGTQCVTDGTAPNNIQNCVAYDDSNKCVKCANNFGVMVNGACAKPTNCASADPSDGSRCLTCDPDYILKLDGFALISCVDRRLNDNSTSYDTNYPYMITQCSAYLTTGFCGMCENGFLLDAQQMCELDQEGLVVTQQTYQTSVDLKCLTQILNDPTKCSICMKPYRPADNGYCQINRIDNCKQIGTINNCKECVEGYVLNPLQRCVPLMTNIPNCNTSSDGFASCSQCDANYLPSYNLGQCVSIATPIAKCLRVNSLDSSPGTKCLECQASFDIKSDMSACVTQIPGCKVYSDAGDCSECYQPNYYLSVQTSTSGTQTQSCTIANVPFCVENQLQSDACPNCCNKCLDGFGLKTWTEGTVTKNACVYNKLQCAQDRCISYESFTDWSQSTCTNLAPQPPKPPINTNNTNSTVTPKPNTNDSLNTILINTVALVAIVVSVSVLL